MDGDTEQVRAVHDALPGDARIRVDANATWSVDEAVARLDAMAPLELAEQPVATLEEMGALRDRTDVAACGGRKRRDRRGRACRGAGLRRGDREAREGR